MKPTAYFNTKLNLISTYKGGEYIVPLYTVHEIADFIKGLYFDDTLANEQPLTFARIAEILEKEGA